ncbi:hypothetical protein LOTGIDRAFT_196970 [Lottia gigantea]|uniref:F-box domain-containing protein n=1 Tax=Lottia gigantea TaxID=225164 RepID=V3ZS78_LOTGI|nr:hypothetical protein LOTGIDRAFT_196970 [Lottia gigantea]ESO83751.1 hypothetical protein LOTGIDRAFT_196970 [Lottia gigantea]
MVELENKLEKIEKEKDYFQLLSLEIICKIFKYVSLFDVLKLSSQCRKFQQAVSMYLRILKSIDFTQGQLHGWMPATVNDDHLNSLLPKCRELEYIYGFHPAHLSKRRLRNCRHTLSIPGILAALNFASKLKGIEISDITLLSAVLNYFPNLKILGTFRNRMTESALENDRFSFTVNPKVTSLHLTGITIPCLPKMDMVLYLYLHQVKITNAHPFREFLVPKLQTFVMSNCCGPVNALSYVPLFAGLAAAQPLTRLELVKVPFMGGLIHHIVEDSWRANGFRQLTNVLFSSCRNALEMDLGFLLITAADKLKELSIQPSLTKDSLFSALNMADVQFDNLNVLSLGYVDVTLEQGDVSVYEFGNNVVESPAMITDNGMKAVGQTFQDISQMEVYNCPHLIQPCTWFSSVVVNWAYLQHLTLRRCHSVRLQDFSTFISHLPRLEMLQLEYMFREPPKGCSRVGLSAGTGLGVSSALVQNHAHGNDIQPNQPADEEQEVEDEDDLNNNDDEEMNRAEEADDDENIEIEPIIMLNNARAVPVRNQQNVRLVANDNDNVNDAEGNIADEPPLPAEQPPLPPEPPKKKTGTTGSTRKSSSRQTSKKSQNGSMGNEGQTSAGRSRRSSVSLKRKKSIHDKATSTSDPVMEDDHIQVLLLRSDSLVCVKLHMVGITDLIIEDCPELSSVSGSACRVLKKVTIYSAPNLSKTNFVQCKKLDQTHLVNEVCDQISEHNRVIFLRPMHEFNLRDFEAMLFQQPDICYYIGIIYDYSPCPNQTLYNRVRVTNWLELFSRLNIDFVRCMDFVETSWYRVDANTYPWKRDIYRMQGLNENGSKWEMITDIPWIRMLSQCPDIKHHNQVADDFKGGLYCQGAKGHFNKEDARDGIVFDLAEFQDANQTFFINNIIVYFNMCDTSGVPTPDFYL